MRGIHSPASRPPFSWRFTRGAASVRLSRSLLKAVRVSRSAAHKPESWASDTATMCSMSVPQQKEGARDRQGSGSYPLPGLLAVVLGERPDTVTRRWIGAPESVRLGGPGLQESSCRATFL